MAWKSTDEKGRSVRTFFTADEHYGHAAIIKHTNRIDPRTGEQFADVNRHDAHLIDMHNAIVGPRDRVIHVGDFAFRCDSSRMRAILQRLNGQHFLVVGNHDSAETLALPWAAVPKQIMVVNLGEATVTCCHYAMRVWPAFDKSIHAFGHSHGRLPGNTKSCDVGVDCWNLRPVSLPEIQARLAATPTPAEVEVEREPDGGLTP